jgi:hypothetical protein
MILCLDLEYRRRGTNTAMTPGFDVLWDALERACAIWRDVQSTSAEAWKAYQVLTGMLLSFQDIKVAQVPPLAYTILTQIDHPISAPALYYQETI